MQYLERTLQVRTALFKEPHLLEKMRAIFASHIAQDHVHEPIGNGNSRSAYEVGSCEIVPGVKISLLLKLMKNELFLKFRHAAKRSKFSSLSEFGAFELYYDFVAGHVSTVSFRTKAGYDRYCEEAVFGRHPARTFSLDANWGGTMVARGDLGAVPYFNLAVRYQHNFGQLTEGLPPFIKPKRTATCRNTMDDYTVEYDRIIDIGPTQCFLIDIDQGGTSRFDARYPGNLGVRRRGEKYFRPGNRLDI